MIPDKDKEIIEKYIGHNYDIINKKKDPQKRVFFILALLYLNLLNHLNC